MKAENNSRYIKITRSEEQSDGQYLRSSIIVFEDHLEDFIHAFTDLFHSAAYLSTGYQTVMDIADEAIRSKGIKAMPSELRPREKLCSQGAASLRDDELLAILLGSGSPGETSIELAGKILSGNGGQVQGLSKASVSSLHGFRGMGMAKVCAVLAAVELGRRIGISCAVKLKVAT